MVGVVGENLEEVELEEAETKVVEVVVEAEEVVFHLGEGEAVTQVVEVGGGSFVQNDVGVLQVNSQEELQEKEEEEHHKHLLGDLVGPVQQLQVKLDP